MSEWINVFMPGRLCLLGEHSDWASSYRKENIDIEKGYSIILGIDKGIYLKSKKSNMFSYKYQIAPYNIVYSNNIDEIIHLDSEDINEFMAYVLAAYRLMLKRYKIGGAEIICTKMDLPMKKGLASSAAICMAIVRTFNYLYELNLNVEDEMEIAYQAEQSIGSKCGRLDQICGYGSGLRMAEFDQDLVRTRSIRSGDNIYILLVDLNGNKDTKKILSDLNEQYPFPQSKSAEMLFDALGKENKDIVNNAVNSISDGNMNSLGSLMYQAQKIFDEKVAPYSYENLKAEKLHGLLQYIRNREYVLGAKGVGSQGDGMAQILMGDRESMDDLAFEIESEFHYKTYKIQYLREDLEAVVPIAGYGTRLYPITCFMDKAELPIYYKGKLYPVLYLILKDIAEAGIKNIDVIIRKEQMEYMQSLAELMRTDGYDLNIITSLQKENNGLGAAIGCSSSINVNSYTLIALGDYIYISDTDVSCTSQLVSAWRQYKEPIITIKEVALEDTPNYGIVYGDWVDDGLMIVKDIVEKPSAEYAENNLAVKEDGKKHYYCIFGEYLLNDRIMKLLHNKNKNINTGEIGLTESISEYAKENKLLAIKIKGKSFDVGIPQEYYNTFCQYPKETI